MSNDSRSLTDPWTILGTLQWTAGYFSRSGIAHARAVAEILLAHTLGCERIDLYLRYDQPLNADELARYKAMIQRRAQREPEAYIIGHKEFWSLTFSVTPDVLIPRPETECLVEAALELGPADGPFHVLELGVGSGAISVALAHERADWTITATDISPQALDVARGNAQRLLEGERITFCLGSWFEPVDGEQHAFDLIISNPPYVAREDLPGLAPELRRFEPIAALDGGPGGMACLADIIRSAHRFLKPNGILALEIGSGQAEAVKAVGRQYQNFRHITIHQDYSGLDRVALFKDPTGCRVTVSG